MQTVSNGLGRVGSIAVPVVIVVSLAMMIFPLPAPLLDLLLTLNITISISILFSTIYIRDSLELSVFPSLLLIVTLYRLALNVASTRRIMLYGHEGPGTVSKVISTFGDFVVGGNYVIGFVIFLILVAIQYVVITNGAQRVAEVAARFTLDAMPGKQMAIDAELNAGVITDDEAHQRRHHIQREADFYGAMDGASKFVKGDAIASMIIIVVNILGGLAVGILQRGLSFSTAVGTYTLLTVGDGLVAQIPALVISTSAGILVTRTSTEMDLGSDITRQVFSQPNALFVTAIALLIFGLATPLPDLPFTLLSFISGGLGLFLYLSTRRMAAEEITLEKEAEATERIEKMEASFEPDPILVEIGYDLIALADEMQGGDLAERIREIRPRCARDLGIVIPLIRMIDSVDLSGATYRISIKGTPVAQGELMVDRYLAMNPGDAQEGVPGVSTTEPAFGMSALWIEDIYRERAEQSGYIVVDPATVLVTHLEEVIKRHAAELLSLQAIRTLLDHLAERNPVAVNEVVPEVLSLVDVRNVLARLLTEQVSIRNLTTILETLADNGRVLKDTRFLTEKVRQSLRREIVEQHLGPDRQLHVLTLHPELEATLLESIQEDASGRAELRADARLIRTTIQNINETTETVAAQGIQPALLCAPALRPHLSELVHLYLPSMAVLSYEELTTQVETVTDGVIQAS